MLFFRSEEHLARWCEQKQGPKGAVLSLETAWRLADAFYRDRLDPAWTRPPVEAIERLYAGLGLTGDFWRLR